MVRIGVDGRRFIVEGIPAFLLGVNYRGALGAPDDFILWDLSELRELGFNWVSVSAAWSAFGDDVSAVTAWGEAREPYLSRLRRLCATTAEMGFVLGLSLDGEPDGGSVLADAGARLRAATTLAHALAAFRHVYLDLGDVTEVASPDRVALCQRCHSLDPGRLVMVSHRGDAGASDAITHAQAIVHAQAVGADALVLCPSRQVGATAGEEPGSSAWERLLRAPDHPLPLLRRQPFRRGLGASPSAADCLADLQAAHRGGAAGWCFDNGPDSARADGRPRRCHDMGRNEGRLLDQLEPEELAVLEQAGGVG